MSSDRYQRTVTVTHVRSCPAYSFGLGYGETHKCECGATEKAWTYARELRQQSFTVDFTERDPHTNEPVRMFGQ